MKAARLFSCFAACFILTPIAKPSEAQQPITNPITACGSTEANFAIRKTQDTQAPAQPSSGKALVYVIESMPDTTIFTTKVNIGMDGVWLGTTEAQTHFSFTVDPGVHHLCAVYQGQAASMDAEGQTLLLRLNAKAGHTYYINYHAFFSKESPSIAFFDFVNEDEGELLALRTDKATFKLKK